MVSFLIESDCTVDAIFNGVIGCIKSYADCIYDDLSAGSIGEISLIVLQKLLDANASVMTYTNLKVTTYNDTNILHEACTCQRGEISTAVVKLFLTKSCDGIKSVDVIGYSPIHYAAQFASLDVMQFLYMMYPESLAMVTNNNLTLLHLALYDKYCDFSRVKSKVEYLCDQCPTLVHMKGIQGNTPLHKALISRFNIESIKSLCHADEAVVRDKCSPSDMGNETFEQLPLHLLIVHQSPISEVSEEGDCFRLLLRLYPASAGIKGGHLRSPYDLAISKKLSMYFIRLLLCSDADIDPEKRQALNYLARREGMFLAFGALSARQKANNMGKDTL